MDSKITIRLLILLLIFFAGTIQAQIIQTDIKDLSRGADAIVTGRVLSQSSQWNSDKTRIFTKVTVGVSEVIKGGTSQSTLTIITPGGEVGEVGELYTHMPRFDQNEEMLLFLKKADQNTYSVFQGDEGKITLYSDIVQGEKVTAQKMNLSVLKSEIKRSLSVR